MAGSFDFSKVPRAHHLNQIHINQFIFAILAEEKCQEAGVEIAYYEFPTSVKKTEKGWQVDCMGFGTKRRVYCKQIVDCTGGAEVVGLLGFERLRKRKDNPALIFNLGATHNPASKQCIGFMFMGRLTNSRTATRANLTGRKSIFARVRRDKKDWCTCSPKLVFVKAIAYLEKPHYRSGLYIWSPFWWCSWLCVYPVDLHTRTGVKPKPLKRGIVPTIPLGALIPKGSENIIVAGRCISSDRLANSGLRVQSACMAMGQAAGATAALAAKSNSTPHKVALSEIHSLLRQHNAIIPSKA